MINTITNILKESITTKQQLLQSPDLLLIIQNCVSVITNALQAGNKVMLCGNGGSAADAQHLAAEFSGRFYKDREALPAEALHCNSSYLTAVANDYSYEVIYSRLVQGIGKPGDVLIGLSTSGNSKNIVAALSMAQQKNIHTIALTGTNGGNMQPYTNYLINVPSTNTPRIQECHITIGHIICQLVEEKYFEKTP